MRNWKFPGILGGALIILGAHSAWQLNVKNKYDELREEVGLASQFVVHPMDAEAKGFLETVKASWEVEGREQPVSAFAEIASLVGVEESVDGVVAFYTHRIPPYSFFNHRRNNEEVVMAMTLAVALPISVDDRVYNDEGICFIKLGENLVEVFEDVDQELGRTLYVKPPDEDEKRGAGPDG